jgi:hypothetical protein
VYLEAADFFGGRRVGRAFEPGGEPLAAGDVAALCVRVELARSHVFDHSQTQRTRGYGATLRIERCQPPWRPAALLRASTPEVAIHPGKWADQVVVGIE